MYSALKETIELAHIHLNEEQMKVIQDTLEKIQVNPRNYNLKEFYNLDITLGGMGGCCFPIHPVHNPFPHNHMREIFRPLQYAFSDICLSISTHARFVVCSAGMHLESTIRYILQNHCFGGKLRFYNTTLGKATNQLEKLGLVPIQTMQSLYKFVSLYNKSKHEINMSEDRARLFAPSDALVLYCIVRILGNDLLSVANLYGSPSPKLLEYTRKANIEDGFISIIE